MARVTVTWLASALQTKPSSVALAGSAVSHRKVLGRSPSRPNGRTPHAVIPSPDRSARAACWHTDCGAFEYTRSPASCADHGALKRPSGRERHPAHPWLTGLHDVLWRRTPRSHEHNVGHTWFGVFFDRVLRTCGGRLSSNPPDIPLWLRCHFPEEGRPRPLPGVEGLRRQPDSATLRDQSVSLGYHIFASTPNLPIRRHHAPATRPLQAALLHAFRVWRLPRLRSGGALSSSAESVSIPHP